nr:RNA-directed DNA polymerase, eukaryota, reverse transcriptase zinc-binding domain protein [Tanacetum cinerariifolium]
MGDDNVSLHVDNHSEGMSFATQDMIDFHECINDVEMDDICKYGLHFTWTKSLLNHNAIVLKKFDRIIGNDTFLVEYNNANVVFLPYGISDHNPAILICPQVMKKKNNLLDLPVTLLIRKISRRLSKIIGMVIFKHNESTEKATIYAQHGD